MSFIAGPFANGVHTACLEVSFYGRPASHITRWKAFSVTLMVEQKYLDMVMTEATESVLDQECYESGG